MSSFGVRRARSTDSRVADSILDEDSAQIESEKIFKETGDANTANSPGIANLATPAGNFLARDGDTWQGPHGSQIGIVEIIDDTIDVSLGSQNYFPFLVLNGEGGADDNLSRIVPGSGVFFNQQLTVQAGSFAITLQELVGGNLLTPGTVNVILQPGDSAGLFFSIVAGNKWIVKWFSSNVGGGGGVSFPIDFPITFLGTIGSITQIIDFSLSTRHGWKAEFNGDVELAFDNPPTGEQGFATFKFKQDVTGGHTLTLPIGTINKDIVESGFLLGSEEETGIVIQFFDDTFYAFLETGNVVSGGGGGTGDVVGPASATDNAIARFDGTTGKLIQNSGIIINDSDQISGVTGISGTGAGVIISGIDTYDFFQAGQSFQNKADPDGGILYNVNDIQSHIFRANTVEIARFEESAASVYRLNMLDHAVRDARDITFSSGSGATIFAGSSPAIGFDSVASSLVINFPAGAKIVISENNSIGSAEIRLDEVTANLLTANSSLLIGLLGGAPTVSGQFTNDGTDTFVFSGAAVRNLSNIGVAAGGANVNLSNLTATSVNDDIIPQAGKLLGSSGNEWSSVHSNNYRLGTAGVVSATSNQILGTGSGIDFNVPSTFNFDFLVNGANIGSISSSGALTFSSLSVSLLVHLDNIGAFAGINGDMYLEGSDVKIVSGGIERNVSDIGTGTFLPLAGGTLTGELSMNNNDIVNIDDLRFNTANMNIISSSTILSIDVPSNQTFRIRDGTTTRFTIVGLDTGIAGNNGNLGFFGTTPVAQQSVASDTTANLYIALRAYGIIA